MFDIVMSLVYDLIDFLPAFIVIFIMFTYAGQVGGK